MDSQNRKGEYVVYDDLDMILQNWITNGRSPTDPFQILALEKPSKVRD